MSYEIIVKKMENLPWKYEEMRETVAKAIERVLPFKLDENDKIIIDIMEKIDFIPGEQSLYYVRGHVEAFDPDRDKYMDVYVFNFCLIDSHGGDVYVKDLADYSGEDLLE